MDRLNRVYLIRHGQVVGHEGFPICGHTDVAITDVGVAQFEHLAERLRHVDLRAIYSSDLKRSAEGARIMARHHNSPLHALQELREMYFGDWEGKTLSEIQDGYPGVLERRKADIVHFEPPGNGESVAQVSERILPCFKRILKEEEGGDIVLIGHGVVNRVILAEALGLDLANMFNLGQDYGCLNIIDYFEDGRSVKLVNG